MTGERFTVLALLALCLFLFWRGNGTDPVDDRADELALIAAQRDSATERADSLTRIATRADTTIALLRDSMAVKEAQVRTVLVTQLDTLEVRTDTTTFRMIAQRDTLWQDIVDSRDSLIVELDSAVVFWRLSSFAKDTVILGWERQDSVRLAVNSDLRAHIRGLNRRSWLERSAALLAIGCAVVC